MLRQRLFTKYKDDPERRAGALYFRNPALSFLRNAKTAVNDCVREHDKPDGSGRWKEAVPNVVRMIEQKTHRFYTAEGGATAWVGVRTSAAGNKFLQTFADGIWKDNLLALKECG